MQKKSGEESRRVMEIINMARILLFDLGMDPFLEFQRALLLKSFLYWGIALILGGSMRFLVRNVEAWKTRLLAALFPEPSETTEPSASFASSEPFGEQALLALDFRPCCPRCQEPMQERRTRNLRNGDAFFWGCSAFPRCRGTRIEMQGRALY